MRSEATMYQLFMEIAKADDRILAVYMNGSRTNSNVYSFCAVAIYLNTILSAVSTCWIGLSRLYKKSGRRRENAL